MMRHVLELLRRQPATPHPRPNALRLEDARAERLRREAQRRQPAPGRPSAESEENRPRREQPPALPPASPRPALLTRPLSRAELRRAILLGEIIGPPLALREMGDG